MPPLLHYRERVGGEKKVEEAVRVWREGKNEKASECEWREKK